MLPDTVPREIDIDAPPDVVWAIVPGTRLRVVESGFRGLSWPGPERARYADQNASGWIKELDELRAYAARAAGPRRTR